MKGQRQDNPAKGTKGNKRKRKDEPGVAEPKRHARSVSAPQKASTAVHAQPTEVLSGFQRMDEETTTYLNEVKAHLDTLDDGEEISLLVSLQPTACQWTCHLVKLSLAYLKATTMCCSVSLLLAPCLRQSMSKRCPPCPSGRRTPLTCSV